MNNSWTKRLAFYDIDLHKRVAINLINLQVKLSKGYAERAN